MARFLKPKDGLIVRHPVTYQPLPPEGCEVSETDYDTAVYWAKKLAEGDAQVVEKPKAAPAPFKAVAPVEADA